MAEKEIFRAKALEQLSTPEQLDQLLRVVNRSSWIPISGIGVGLLLALIWGVWGQIPITVSGEGVLLYPRQVVTFQMPASGQILALDVQVGDLVEKGQVLGRINQPELRTRLDQERLRLAEQLARKRDVGPLAEQRLDLERQSLEIQRGNLVRLRDDSRRLATALQERHRAYESLRSEGLSSDDVVLDARRNYLDNKMRLADLELKLQQLDVRSAQLEQQRLEKTSDSALRIQEIQRNIERYEQELENRSEILSDHGGRVLEVAAAVGQILQAGQRLGSLQTEDPEGKLVALVFFSVRDGKRLRSGMDIRISPTTVQRERHGSMRGEVATVSRFPASTDAVANAIGNHEVARGLTAGGSRIEVYADLRRDAAAFSGFAWTSGSGPDVEISAGTTAAARATVEYRRPISFVLPIMREWSGI